VQGDKIAKLEIAPDSTAIADIDLADGDPFVVGALCET
jgi:hypothetical protein